MELKTLEVEVRDMVIKELFDRNELRRLEKAAKDKNKEKMVDWGKAFEKRIVDLYEKEYIDIVQHTINNFILVIIFTLHFNEKLKFGKKRIDDFMNDLVATVNCFTNGEYSVQEYEDMLNKDGIHFKKMEN
jgi:hypothetical protein